MSINLLVAIVSVTAAIITFILGIVVLLRNIYNAISFNFCLYAWAITMWSMLSYAFFVNHNNFLLYKFVAAFGGVCLLLITPWVLYLIKQKPNKLLLALLYSMSIFLISIPIWDRWAMTNFIYSDNHFTYEAGMHYYFYALVVFIIVCYTLYLLIKNLFKTTGVHRKLLLLVLAGMAVFMVTDITFGIILPIFHITPLIPYVTIGATFFVTVSSYAIVKYSPVELLSSRL
jgi:hypothetical protein